MHYFKLIKRFFLFFCMALIFLGCATKRGEIDTNQGFSISGRGTPDGILLHFYNIPENAVLLNVTVTENIENSQIHQSALFWCTIAFPDFIREVNQLAQLIETRLLHCPFTSEGKEYTITVFVSANIDDLDDVIEYSINVIAAGGRYLPANVVNFGGMHLLTHDNTEWNIIVGRMPTPIPGF